MAAVVLISVNLRPGATSIGPVLAEILEGLGQNATWGGLLAAMPGVCFALFGAFAVALAMRVGLTYALWWGWWPPRPGWCCVPGRPIRWSSWA